MKKILSYTFIAYYLLLTTSARAQKVDTAAIVAYINLYKDIAISEMNRVGIPASITLAQGIHESGWGRSYLSQNTNNHFGIKCKEEWTGKTFKYTDDAPNECFRVYDKVEDSYKDHSDFLKNRPRYATLFLLDKNDYKGWAYGLKKAGYATNPAYPQILIKMIDDFQLHAFDIGQNPVYVNTQANTTIPVKQEIQEEDEKDYNVTDSMDVAAKLNGEERKIEIVKPVIPTSPQRSVITQKKLNKSIFKVNNCKAVKIYINKGETLDLIGNVLNIEKEDLLTYNDIADDSQIKDGQIIFIQKKKKSNKERTYKVKADDNIWSISQKKGIRLASLLKMNKLESGEEPAAREAISLKGKVHEKPALRPANATKPLPTKGAQESTKSSSGDLGVVRANDTVYPPIQETSKLSVDSNKILGWESETKLLENPAITAYTTKDTSVKIKVAEIKNLPTIADVPVVSITEKNVTIEKTTPTVYPTSIDYSKLPKSKTGIHTVIKGDTMYNICKRYNISIAQITEWNNLSDQSVKLGQVLKIQP